MKTSDTIAGLAAALSKAQSVGWWRDPRYPGYLIGDAGEVFTMRGKGKVLKPSKAGDRYLKVSLKGADGRLHGRYIHQLVAESFLGGRPEEMHTRHIDGNPHNNSIENVSYGTPSENYADKVRHERATVGEKNGMSKLTWSEVNEIREKLISDGS